MAKVWISRTAQLCCKKGSREKARNDDEKHRESGGKACRVKQAKQSVRRWLP